MIFDFSALKKEANSGIDVLIKFYDYIVWKDFSDNSDFSYNSTVAVEQLECDVENLWLAAVRAAMVKGSTKHRILSAHVSKKLGCRWVTYNCLTKIVSRIFLCSQSIDSLVMMIDKAANVKNTTVNTIERDKFT